jgi:hypothetical protein
MPMKRWQHALLTTLGTACLLAAAAGATLSTMNRELQGQVNQRQQYLQQSVQLEGLYREMVRALAELAARRSDDDLQRLLGKHGISVSVAPPPAAGAAVETKGARK